MEIGTEEKARQRIVEKALEMIDSTAQSAAREILTLRNQLSLVKAEIGRLVAVLRSMGPDALESIQCELVRLEGEQKDYERRISELDNQATPADQVTAIAKSFIENWSGLGELLAAADGDQQREILQHFVEVIEVHPTDEQGRDLQAAAFPASGGSAGEESADRSAGPRKRKRRPGVNRIAVLTCPLQTSPRLERESRLWAQVEGEHSDAARNEV